MTRFHRAAHIVDAMRFDGTAQQACFISARFADVAVHDGDRIEVTTGFGRVYAGAGCWIVRDIATRAVRVVDDREFTTAYTPIAA